MTKSALLKEVERRLPPSRPNLKLTIVDEGVRRDGDWWYIPVHAEGADGAQVPLGVYVNALSVLEQRLYEDLKLNVLTIPAG